MTARNAARHAPPTGLRARRRRLAVELARSPLRRRVGALLAGLLGAVLAVAHLLDGAAV